MTIMVEPASNGWAVLRVLGEFDISLADEVRATGTEALRGQDVHSLRIDLSEVTFLDSTGLGALISLRNAAQEAGGDAVLVRPTAAVDRVLVLTQLDSVFTTER